MTKKPKRRDAGGIRLVRRIPPAFAPAAPCAILPAANSKPPRRTQIRPTSGQRHQLLFRRQGQRPCPTKPPPTKSHLVSNSATRSKNMEGFPTQTAHTKMSSIALRGHQAGRRSLRVAVTASSVYGIP